MYFFITNNIIRDAYNDNEIVRKYNFNKSICVCAYAVFSNYTGQGTTNTVKYIHNAGDFDHLTQNNMMSQNIQKGKRDIKKNITDFFSYRKLYISHFLVIRSAS